MKLNDHRVLEGEGEMSKRTNRVAAAMARPVEVTAAMRLQERTKPVSRFASIGQVTDRRAPKPRKPEGPCKQRRRASRVAAMEYERGAGERRRIRQTEKAQAALDVLREYEDKTKKLNGHGIDVRANLNPDPQADDLPEPARMDVDDAARLVRALADDPALD